MLTAQIIEARRGAENVITDGAAFVVVTVGTITAGITALWEWTTENKPQVIPLQKANS